MRIIIYKDGVLSSTKQIDINKSPKEKGMSFQPSASSFWLDCAGYSLLDDGGLVSPAAIRGSELHAEAEEDLYQALVKKREPKLEYTKYVMSRIPTKGTVLIGIEVFFQHRTINNFRGFVDCLIVKEEEKSIEIIDYKTGFKIVSAKTNTQLGCYLKLISNSNTLVTREKIDLKEWTVIFTIHQQDLPSTWVVTKPWMEVFVDTIDKHMEKYKKVHMIKNDLFNHKPSCSSCFRNKLCPMVKNEVSKQLKVLDPFLDFTKVDLLDMPEPEFVDLWQKSKKVEKFVKSIVDTLKLRFEKGDMTLVEEKPLRTMFEWKKNIPDILLKDSRFAFKMLISASKGKDLMRKGENDLYLNKMLVYSIKLKKEFK